MSRIELSVIICAHNPRPHYLRRVLKALDRQTLSKDKWELLLIDNASEERLEQKWGLDWHPNARHVYERRLGLTPARLRGINESTGGLATFIDDDNVVDSDYLTQALALAEDWPQLGAWGGQIAPEFEERPPEWTRPFLGLLAVRDLQENLWANSKHAFDAMPCGAGMVVRRAVCLAYQAEVMKDPLRFGLGRRGTDLASCEDADLAYSAIDCGYGFGVFPALKLTHLIPPSRLTEEYILRLVQAMTCSSTVLEEVHQNGHGVHSGSRTGFARLAELISDSRARKLFLARRRGKRTALRLLGERSKGA